MNKERKVLKGHFGKVYAMHWSEDNVRLVSASQDGKLIIWDAMANLKIQAIPLRSSWVMTCAYSPGQGNFVACGGLDNLCTIYPISGASDGSLGEKKQRAELQQHEGYLSCCRFVDENQIVTSSGDTSCILWDIDRSEASRSFLGHDGDVMSVAVNGASSQFVSGSCDMTAKLWYWRVAGNACQKSFLGHGSDINCVSLFPDNQCFGSASDDSSCRLFDLRSCKQVNKYLHHKVVCGVTSVAFSLSGRMLFSGYDDHDMRIWDTLTGNELKHFLCAHTTRVSCLGVSKDGRALCTGSWDSMLKIWAYSDGK